MVLDFTDHYALSSTTLAERSFTWRSVLKMLKLFGYIDKKPNMVSSLMIILENTKHSVIAGDFGYMDGFICCGDNRRF